MTPVGVVMAEQQQGMSGDGGPYVKLQTIIDPGNILQHLTFTLAGRDMKSLIECVLLCSSLVTSLINSPHTPAPSLSLGKSFHDYL